MPLPPKASSAGDIPSTSFICLWKGLALSVGVGLSACSAFASGSRQKKKGGLHRIGSWSIYIARAALLASRAAVLVLGKRWWSSSSLSSRC